MRSKSKRTALLTSGIILIILALCLVGYNLWTQSHAGDTAQDALDSLKEVAPVATSDSTVPTDEGFVEDELLLPELSVPDYVLDSGVEMTEQEIDGVPYIGYLEIPALELELPVISTSTYPYLRIAPCRFYGSVYMDNMVIGAHNYSTHFGDIHTLQKGDLVTFTDMDGNVFSYQVAEQIILQPDESEILCDGQWPLSLYTCTVGGSSRVTVRCEKAELSQSDSK